MLSNYARICKNIFSGPLEQYGLSSSLLPYDIFTALKGICIHDFVILLKTYIPVYSTSLD